jgi:hypothetical protein
MVEKTDPSNKREAQEGNLAELLKQMAASTEKGGAALGGPSAAPKVDGRPAAAATQRDAIFFGKNSGSSGELPKTQPVVVNSSTTQGRAVASAGAEPANKPATIQYIDDHNVREIFADGLNTVHFDGHTLRIEFGVTRAKRSESAASQVLERLPACRLVLSPQAITELKNLMQKISSAAPQNPASVPGRE